ERPVVQLREAEFARLAAVQERVAELHRVRYSPTSPAPREDEAVSTNGSQPRRRRRTAPPSRRLRLLLGLGAAVVVGAALVAPVVLRGGGQQASCSPALHYLGRAYVARRVSSPALVEATAIGTAV